MKIKELMPELKIHGRTIYDEDREMQFCNWTCSGFTVGVEETGDERLKCFEFVQINMLNEGFGVGGHPSVKTHIRMGKELVSVIRKLIGE